MIESCKNAVLACLRGALNCYNESIMEILLKWQRVASDSFLTRDSIVSDGRSTAAAVFGTLTASAGT